MSLNKKKIIKKLAAKRSESKAVIVIKSTTKDDASFSKKVKAINALLAKSTLLS